jgi:hypothetical protein
VTCLPHGADEELNWLIWARKATASSRTQRQKTYGVGKPNLGH